MKFSMVIYENVSIEVEDSVVEKIIGGIWHGRSNLGEWI